MTTYDQQYDGKTYHTYPLYSSDGFFDPAIKRFTNYPTPQEILDNNLKGIPKTFPLTGETITTEFIEPFLTSAINEIEMDLNMCITKTEKWQSFDNVIDKNRNFHPMKLNAFPATSIVDVRFKYPHTTNNLQLMSLIVPPGWISFKRNKVNIVAGTGSLQTEGAYTPEGLQNSIGNVFPMFFYSLNSYQPNLIEVRYIAGFEEGFLPAIIADLIKTVATIRLLNDISPLLFPITSTSVSLDGVGQSQSLPGPQLLLGRINALERKREELQNAIKKSFGRSIVVDFIGS